MEAESAQDCFTNEEPVDQEDKAFLEELKRLKRQEKEAYDAVEALRKEFAQDTKDLLLQAGAARSTSTNTVNTASTPVSTASPSGGLSYTDLTSTDKDDSQIHALEDIYDNPNDGIFTNASYDDEGVVADFTNLETIMNVSPIPPSRIHSIHPSTQILGDPKSTVQTRSKVNKSSGAHAFVNYIQKQRRNNHKDFQHCLFACFLSQIKPKKISEALEDENLPYRKKAIGTKWVYINKKDKRGVVVRNKARIEAIRIFLAFASYMGFIVYQMDVKSAFLYGTIDEEVYVSQLPGFVDPKCPKKVYKVVKALYGLHQAPKACSTKRSWCDEFEALMKNRFQMKILKKFDFASVKTASTPIETHKPLVKDEEATDVDIHLYRSMIGSLMYLTASRPDIMFADHDWLFTVTPKTSHLKAVKRIFRYLKGKPKLGLWYPKVSSFDLEAYSDCDYAGANLDRKSTTRGSNIDNGEYYLLCKILDFTPKTKLIEIRQPLSLGMLMRSGARSLRGVIGVPECNWRKELFELVLKNLLLQDFVQFLGTKFSTANRLIVSKNRQKFSTAIISATFVEFWTSAKSRTINNISYIDAIIAGKPVTISEASIRSDLLFDDAAGIDTLNNQAIFDTIQLMGDEGDLNVLTFNKAFFSPQWKFLFHTMNHCISPKSTSWDQIPTNIATSLRDVPVPMDHFPVPALTKKILLFMDKKGKNFSGNVTPLLNSMLVQPTENEGEVSERSSESQPIPSPTHPTEDQSESQLDPSPRHSSPNPITDSNPEGSGGNHGGQLSCDRSLLGNEDGLTLQSVYDLCISLCIQVTAQAAEIKYLKARIKQLKKKARPVINHHKAWFRVAKLKKQQKKKDMEKPNKRRSVSKQGRKDVKSSKGAPSVQTNTDWDAFYTDLDKTINEAMDYTFAQDEGKIDSKVEEPETSSKTKEFHLSGDTLVVKEKDSVENGVGIEDQVSIDKPKVSTDKLKVSTDKPKVNTNKIDEGTAEPKDGNSDESVVPATVFRDDETIAKFLVSMSQNKAMQKGVEIKDTEDTDRPRTTSDRSILTLNPLPKIDPKDKGKKVLEEEDESDAESEGVNEAEKKFKMLASDEEMVKKVQEEWEAEEEKKRLAEEEATKAAFTNEYDSPSKREPSKTQCRQDSC
ncbi:putative ribonuclease H-like domain-containing protein [Tanacetum coccineum]